MEGSRTKVVLVQPKVGFEGASFWEPLSFGYIIAHVKKRMQDRAEFEVYSGYFDSDKTIIEACKDADIVGFGCTSPQMKHGIHLAESIKLLNPGVRNVFGGYGPSAMPFETRSIDAVDQVVMGEGEWAMEAMIKGNRSSVLVSRKLPFMMMPEPDREAIRNERYIELAEKDTGERITSVQSSRGCPFNCLPCSNSLIHGRDLRIRIPMNVHAEMVSIKDRYKLDFIKFCDATFNTSESKVREFCSMMEQMGTFKDWWGCNIHPAFASPEMFEHMKAAGCREVWIGVESGSPNILKELRKGATVEQIRNTFQWAKDAGLLRRAYFLIGAPSETWDDITLTTKLAEEIDADVYGFTILCPYPGTELFDYEKHGDIDWATADEYGNKFWRNKKFTNEELWKIREALVEQFKDKMCWRLKK